MAYTAFTTAMVQVGKFFTQTFAQRIKDNFDFLYGQSASVGALSNGSFEIDADADNVADGWTFTAYAGGTITRVTTDNAHGEACVKMVHPGGSGNGGGHATSDYVPIASLYSFVFGCIYWANAAGMHTYIQVLWYDDDKVACSPTASNTVYSSTANPSNENQCIFSIDPPSDARFAKIRLIGGYTDTDVAGTTYFDNVTLTPSTRAASILKNTSFTERSFKSTPSAPYWADTTASFTLPITHLNVPITINVPVQVKTETSGGDYTASSRLRQGSNYGGEISTDSTSYVNDDLTYTFTPTSVGDLLFYVQLYNENETTYSYVKMDTANITVTVGDFQL
jgi:hypothetical protein